MSRNMHNLSQIITAATSILPQTITTITTTNGASVDRTGYMGCMVVANVATLTGSGTPTIVVKLQESADNATFTDITGQSNSYTATANNVVYNVDLQPRLKYIRVAVVSSGTTISSLVDAVMLLGGAEYSSSVAGGLF